MFNLPSVEEKILKYWQDKNIFQKSLEKESPQGDYVFYDGPPFATGTPHYGHIVASIMKDIVPRYWTMKGYHVERKWGWDTHGLPIENIIEKELKLERKKDIEKLGVDKFNNACRSKVMIYADEWRKVIDRLGRWVDMDDDYKTMDLNFMESIWWVFKELWDKGLIYEGYKSMHICPRCETTLSQSEVSQGYQDVQDLSVVAKFKLAASSRQSNATLRDLPDMPINILAWTTTPWTLPGNVALAIGADIDYSLIEFNDEYFILAKANIETIMGGKKYKVIRQLKGKDLEGLEYEPLFPYYNKPETKNIDNAFKIYIADFVTIEDGTGVVHIAPAFGEDDMNLGREKNLPFIQHVKMDGHFTDDVVDFVGLEVKPKGDTQKTDVEIIKYLASKNLLFAKEKYKHSYPHCWRCDTPLLNYATSSWFVDVTKLKDKALKLAEEISWTPRHIKEGRFGKWLAGARDWSISRQRYWGSAMPIWVCGECQERRVIGSINELEKLSGEKITDLHKHIVDNIEIKCNKCGGIMKRIPDVLDCWFESGSMPYAQMHYPFENKEKFEDNFPAQFIAEGADQTRAWFYYLHILATGLKNKVAFKNAVVNGIVLAEDGKKMSKKLQNYPDPMEVFSKYGADAVRYYLTASPVMRAEDLNFSEKDLAEQTRFINTLFNVLSFYQMFARDKKVENVDGKKDLINILDIWITARTEQFKKKITQEMDKYNLNSIREIPIFVEDLSTWYIRRSRDRFKGEEATDKMRALKTLRHVLFNLAKIMAPFTPFIAEHIYQELNGEGESIHLQPWPEVDEKLINFEVIDRMDVVRKIVEQGLAARATVGIKVRQPLNQLSVIGHQLSDDYSKLIKDELNIKNIEYKKGNGNLFVKLDTNITDELKLEGLYRELVRTINQKRKQMKLTIKDKIIVAWNSPDKSIKQAFAQFSEELKKNVLAIRIEKGDQGEKLKVNSMEILLKIKKV